MESETIKPVSEISQCFELLEEDAYKVKLGPKEAVLVLGVTGTGTTTLVRSLAHDNTYLSAKEAGENVGEFAAEGSDNTISANSTFVSKTIYPDLIVDPQTHTSYYVFHGFDDTRGAAFDIARTYVIRKIIKNVEKLKILLIVNYSSVRRGAEREDLRHLVERALNLMTNTEKYSKSIALIVTKAENSTRTEGKRVVVPVADEVTLKYVVMFLEMFKQNVEKVTTGAWASKAKKFVDVLLTKNALGYERIGLARRPEEPGPLSEAGSSTQNGTASVQKIVEERMVYTTASEEDFGYTISDKSKNDINETFDELDESVSRYAGEVGREIQKYYEAEEAKCTDVYKLLGELNSVHEKLQNLLDIAKKHISVTRFVKELLVFAREFRVNVPKDRMVGVLRQDKYLEFLKDVSPKRNDESSLMWRVGLRSTVEYVAGARKWYNFTSALHDRLSSYSVQKRKAEFEYILQKEMVDVHDARLKRFVGSQASDLRLEEILNLKIDPVKLNVLNRILRSTLSSDINAQYDEHSSTYDVRGTYVLMSGVDNKRLQKAKFLNIFATDTIFIDANLANSESGIQQVSVIAPTWEVVGRRNITLDGSEPCCPLSSRAADGLYTGAAGHAGAPGLPGVSAGNFFGVGARFINRQNLAIFANGGRGSAGQDGGHGAPGYDGASPRNGKDSIHFRTEKMGCGFLCIKRTYCIYGEGGGTGGDGGDGGLGGEGGYPGNIQLLTLHEYPKIAIENTKGQNGKGGSGGTGGRAGLSGASIEARKLLRWWNSAVASSKCSQWDHLRAGRPGKDGSPGGSTKGKRNPVVIPKARPSKILNNYKEFLRESLPTENVKRAKRTEILDMLNENSSIADLYETVDLAEEFVGLENQYASLKGDFDFLPIYRHLLQRVETYAAQPNDQEKSAEYKRILSTLYAAILSKICVIREIPRNQLVADPRKYLESTINDIKEGKFTTEEYRDNYATEIKYTIEETFSFLTKYVAGEIDRISKMVQENVELLVRELKDREGAENPHVDVLRSNLEHHIIIMKIVNAPKQMARLLKSAAIRAQKIMSRTVSVNKYLVLENVVGPVSGFTTSNENKTFHQTIDKAESKFGMRKLFLDVIIQHLANNSTNITLDEKAKIQGYKNQLENIDDDEVPTIKNELSNLFETIVTNVQNRRPDKGAMETEILRKALNTVKICDIGLENCTKITGNEEIRILGNAIDGASVYLMQVQFYMESIVDQVTSLVTSISNEESSTTHEFSHEIMKGGLNDVKVMVQGMQRAFVLPENLDGCFERLERVSNAMTNIYDHVEYYQSLNSLVAYIKNTNSNQEQISNGKMKTVLGSLNAIIESNVLTAVYQQTITTLNRLIFPFADSYASTFDLDLSQHVTNLKGIILNKLQSINSIFEKAGTFVSGKFDKYVYEGDFTRLNNTLGAFYTWKNEDYENTITALVNGEEVILKADVTQGASKHAIKFNTIRIKLRSSDGTVQQQLDNDLQDFQVRLTYLGDSVYRCGNDFYSFTFENLLIVHSLARNEKDEPRYTNKVYEKIKNGDFVLSPYASWSVQLTGSNVDKLKQYTHLVDVELEGHGQFIEDTTLCNGASRNYEVDNTISKDTTMEENRLNLEDVSLHLPNQHFIDDFHSLPTKDNQKHDRNRRSIEMNSSFDKSFEEADATGSSNRSRMLNWLFSGVSKMLTANSSSSFNAIRGHISFNDHRTNSIVTPQIQYDINNSLILTDLLIRKLTKPKPNYFQACAINFENVRACALDIINEFENILETVSTYDGEFEFDPVPLMSKLEAEIINGNRTEFGNILLNAVEDKSRFDEDDFYLRLKLLPGYEAN